MATASPNLVNYNGAAQDVKATTYDQLTVSGGNTKTLANAIVVNSDLTIASSTTLDTGSGLNYAISVGGNWTNNGGTFTPRAGTVTFASAPEIPTIAESGLKDYRIEPWFGVVGPAGVPREIVSRLHGAISTGLKAADMMKRLDALGYEAIGGTADQFAATIKADIARYARIVKAAGIKVEL